MGIDFKMQFLRGEQGENFKINLYDHGCGIVVGDIDADGDDDLYFLNQLGSNALYRNDGKGHFENITEAAGVGLGDRICVGAAFNDYDNDGDQDLYVTSTRGGNTLFRNKGDGAFEDVTKSAGLTHIGHSQTASFFDYDGDGFLDLLLTNSAHWTDDELDKTDNYYPGKGNLFLLARSKPEANILYRNNGKGAFVDVTQKAGLSGKGWGGDVAVFDFDSDGDPDVMITRMFGHSQLYRNEGNGRFTDVTLSTLGKVSWGAIGAKPFDYDGDGMLDLFVTDMHSDMWMAPDSSPSDIKPAARYSRVLGPRKDIDADKVETEFQVAVDVQYDQSIFGNTLYRNLGKGKFEETAQKAGLETFWPWSIATGDLDNDGDEDVFIPAGMGYPFYYWPNSLMMNDGAGAFIDKASADGIEPPPGGQMQSENIGKKPAPKSSRCAAVADLDGDGKLELIVNNFNSTAFVFRNQYPTKNFIAFRLTGTRSNRDAVGAVVRVTTGPRKQLRQVQAAGGYLSQSSKTVHFGLGNLDKLDSVDILWPSGERQRVESPKLNEVNSVTESIGPARGSLQ
jgi:enediyne biosynthesis protein E4